MRFCYFLYNPIFEIFLLWHSGSIFVFHIHLRVFLYFHFLDNTHFFLNPQKKKVGIRLFCSGKGCILLQGLIKDHCYYQSSNDKAKPEPIPLSVMPRRHFDAFHIKICHSVTIVPGMPIQYTVLSHGVWLLISVAYFLQENRHFNQRKNV